MSTESRKFWEDYLQRNGSIDVPALLDAYADAKENELKRLREGIQALIDSEQGFDQDQCVFSANKLKTLLSPADWDRVDDERRTKG